MPTKQPTVTPKDALDEANKDAPRAGNPSPEFVQHPAEGGSYIREGRELTRTQEPTKIPDTAPIDEEARQRDADEAKRRTDEASK